MIYAINTFYKVSKYMANEEELLNITFLKKLTGKYKKVSW